MMCLMCLYDCYGNRYDDLQVSIFLHFVEGRGKFVHKGNITFPNLTFNNEHTLKQSEIMEAKHYI